MDDATGIGGEGVSGNGLLMMGVRKISSVGRGVAEDIL